MTFVNVNQLSILAANPDLREVLHLCLVWSAWVTIFSYWLIYQLTSCGQCACEQVNRSDYVFLTVNATPHGFLSHNKSGSFLRGVEIFETK